MKFLCKMLGGSHSYGLSTPNSDVDLRGVFINTDAQHILGLNSNAKQFNQNQNNVNDEVFWELRHFLGLLSNGNTQALEMVYASDYLEKTPEFDLIKLQKEKLISSRKLISVLKGYAQSERKLANGERTGKLGGKRKEALDKHGFSPKNFVQLLRLLWAGQIFYDFGEFPVNIRLWNVPMGDMLLDIKTHPENWNVKQLNEEADRQEKLLDAAFAGTHVAYEFDQQTADEICFKIYTPIVNDLYSKMNL